jgi:energy-coupling factor transporter ATP-binding protein EcfA2
MDYDIIIDNVTFTYQSGKSPAISGINIRAERGETIAIMGPAGAGKSTVCRLLNGLVPQFFEGRMEGDVLVTGYSTREYSIGFLAYHVGLLLDDPSSQVISPSVQDEIAFGLENYGVPREEMAKRVQYYMKACRLQGYEERNPHTLSGGEQQACIIAAILAMQPRVLVLDEPTSKLDPVGSSQIYSLVADLARKREHTILIADNKVEELVGIVDRILLINHGEILLEGTPEEVMQNADQILKAGVKPPQVSELFHALAANDVKFKQVPITVDDAAAILRKLLGATRISQTPFSHKNDPVSNKPVIETNELWHAYPNGTPALNGVSIKIFEGEFMAIVGQNGSGKTTLIKHFNGLLKPSKGTVKVFGQDTTRTSTHELAKKIGFVFQNPDHQLFASTVRKELEFGLRNLKIPSDDIEPNVEYALNAVRLDRSVLDQSPISLSTALKQRVNIASVLAMRPSVLIVDEPTTGQDPVMAREVMELMRDQNRKGVTIAVVTHDMKLVAEYTSRCIVLRAGKVLLEGSPREVFTQTKILEETYLKPPQITRLAQTLRDVGVPPDIMTVEEMKDLVCKAMGE